MVKNKTLISKLIYKKQPISYEDKLNSSQLKLREAIHYFNLNLDKIKTAIDLGASPGGFSRELSKRGIKVTALDPADLHPSLGDDNNIVHLKLKAEEFKPDEEFDLIVNDMNMHPSESAKILLSLSKFLKKGALCIMTVKCPTKSVFYYIDNVKDILKTDFKDFEFKHLLHNKMEVTMKAVKN